MSGGNPLDNPKLSRYDGAFELSYTTGSEAQVAASIVEYMSGVGAMRQDIRAMTVAKKMKAEINENRLDPHSASLIIEDVAKMSFEKPETSTVLSKLVYYLLL